MRRQPAFLTDVEPVLSDPQCTVRRPARQCVRSSTGRSLGAAELSRHSRLGVRRLLASPPDGRFDPIGGVSNGFVFPDSQDQPSVPFKLEICATIAIHIRSELALPESAIRLREHAVVGARVPKAAVDEDGNTLGREEDVHLRAQTYDRTSMNAVTQSAREQLSTYRSLRACVSRPIGTHRRTSGGGGGRWRSHDRKRYGVAGPNSSSGSALAS